MSEEMRLIWVCPVCGAHNPLEDDPNGVEIGQPNGEKAPFTIHCGECHKTFYPEGPSS